MSPSLHSLFILFFALSAPLVYAATINITSRAPSLHPHSSDEPDVPRGGSQTVTATTIRYEYQSLQRKTAHGNWTDPTDILQQPSKAINSLTNSPFFQGIKPIGDKENVKITWYANDSLKNPRCWPDPRWSPTDQALVAASGSINECFQFKQLCNPESNCIYVRVVDSCAACAKRGEPHYDLSPRVFKFFAPLEKGVMTVEMREASVPKHWNELFWGPKGGGH